MSLEYIFIILFLVSFHLFLDGQEAREFVSSAIVEMERGNCNVAYDDLTRALGVNPAMAEVWYLRGRIMEQMKDISGDLEDYDQVIKLSPGHDEARCRSI